MNAIRRTGRRTAARKVPARNHSLPVPPHPHPPSPPSVPTPSSLHAFRPTASRAPGVVLVRHGEHYHGVFGATKEETATTEEPRVGDESVKLQEELGDLLSKRVIMRLKVDERLTMLPGSIVDDKHVNKKGVIAADGFCLVRSIVGAQTSDDACRRRARTPFAAIRSRTVFASSDASLSARTQGAGAEGRECLDEGWRSI